MSNLLQKEHTADQWRDNAAPYMLAGWGVMVAGFVVFLLWAMLAPLDKGVPSQGTVMVSGNRKEIQAPVSGIITDILVKNGDIVKKGQPLVLLSQTQAKAQLQTLQNQYISAVAAADRLEAERAFKPTIAWSAALDDPQFSTLRESVIHLQSQLFNSRRLSLQSDLEADRQSLEGTRLQLASLEAASASKKLQLSSLREQVANLKTLASDGYLPRNRYLEIQQQYSEASSSFNETLGQIGVLRKQIQETTQRLIQRKAEYERDVQTQLNQMRLEASDYKSKLDLAAFELEKTEVKAPVSGVIVNQAVFTQGGTLATGEHIFDIVPQEKELVIDARLQVDMIDKVRVGLPVDLMFTAFNANHTPQIPGEVSLISADRLVDKEKGEPYYQMQITVTREGMKALNLQEIKPGMSVTVFVKTGSRTLLNYLFKPIVDRMHTSMSEE